MYVRKIIKYYSSLLHKPNIPLGIKIYFFIDYFGQNITK